MHSTLDTWASRSVVSLRSGSAPPSITFQHCDPADRADSGDNHTGPTGCLGSTELFESVNDLPHPSSRPPPYTLANFLSNAPSPTWVFSIVLGTACADCRDGRTWVPNLVRENCGGLLMTTAIMTLDSVLELSVEQLIRALNKKPFMEYTGVQSRVPPTSRALVATLTAEVRSSGRCGSSSFDGVLSRSMHWRSEPMTSSTRWFP